MTNYQKLINKYQDPYVKGEKRSQNYETQLKRKKAIRRRHSIADQLMNEVAFHLTTHEKERIHHLIDTYPNFKRLHGKAKETTIILALIFFIKKQSKSSIQINRYTITDKYQLTHNTFETVLCKLTQEYLSETYIIPREPKQTNHNLLYKGQEK